MNTKNIILAILMVLSFTACSSEIEGIDNNMTNTTVNNNGVTSISVRMTTSNMNTKSASQSTEDAAINTYVIAVFEKATGQRIGYVTGTNQTNGGNVTSTTIDNIDTKEGEVDIIAVANVNADDFNSLYNYDEFANHIVKNNLNDWVKVGKVSATLTKGGENPIRIVLVQLTACVNVELTTEVIKIGDGANNADVKVDFKATGYSAKIATSSTILNPTGNSANAENLNGITVRKESLNVSSFSYTTYAVNKPALTVNTNLSVTIAGDTVKSDSKVIAVPFLEGSRLLACLENGKKYTQEIKVTVTVNSGVNVNPELTYVVVPISEINNEITYD